MTGKSIKSRPDGMTARHLDIQRIRVNRQGYDASGAYWGVGPDVFLAVTADGAEEVTVRAENAKEARSKVAAELDSQTSHVRSERVPIGGNSRQKSRYEISWVNPITNVAVRIRITHSRDYLCTGNDHIEIESMAPSRGPLPITETGYRSHFMPALDLINAGGPVTFVTSWIEHEAKGKAWSKAAAMKAQGDLFAWAEAKTEVAAKQARAPKKPTVEKRKKRAPHRDPK